jgi:hypothetical protein
VLPAKTSKCLVLLIFFLGEILYAPVINASASSTSEITEEEVFLSFRYPGGVNSVVTAYLVEDEFYLPVTELFSLLSINFSVDIQNMTISGHFIDKPTYYILDFRNGTAKIDGDKHDFTGDDALIKTSTII